jgi:hypothetical protein
MACFGNRCKRVARRKQTKAEREIMRRVAPFVPTIYEPLDRVQQVVDFDASR